MVRAAAQELADARERRLWVAEVERVRASAAGLTPAQIEAVLSVLVSVAGSGGSESTQTGLEAAELLDHLRGATAPSPDRHIERDTGRPARRLPRVA